MNRCHIRKIEKGHGKFRLIYAPNASYREDLSRCSKVLASIMDAHWNDCLDHAFVRGRNCVTNAKVHLGKSYLLSMDVKDFFDSIGVSSLSSVIPPEILHFVLEDGAPRQGLPTSPLVANIAMLDVDRRIRDLFSSMSDVSYSRYADDIAIGFDDARLRPSIQQGVERILKDNGLRLNHDKTLFQNSRNGAMKIAGISITNDGIRPTRRTLRRIRAAKHQGNKNAEDGLAEWAKCKMPKKIMAGAY